MLNCLVLRKNETRIVPKMWFLMIAFAVLCCNSTQSAGTIAERQQVITVGNSQLVFTVAPGELSVSRAELAQYVKDGANAVIAYYGKFPVAKTIIRFYPSADDGVGYGSSTFDDPGQYGEITINIGKTATASDLRDSWTLTHELMHLAFPIVSHRNRWLAEGIATYIEPIGRMRIGTVSKEEVWSDLLKNLPKGLPQIGDGGLNHSRRFDRVYWGGALFCLIADVQIRQETKNRLGLEDALVSIARQGGTAASDWSADDAVSAGDKGIGKNVLKSLFAKMSDEPVSIDVSTYLKKLGVIRHGNSVRFDEQAPLASVRRAIDGLN